MRFKCQLCYYVYDTPGGGPGRPLKDGRTFQVWENVGYRDALLLKRIRFIRPNKEMCKATFLLNPFEGFLRVGTVTSTDLNVRLSLTF